MGSESRTCAVCSREMSLATVAGRSITNKVCESCLGLIGAQGGIPLRDFLDGLDVPVVVVDDDVVVKQANKPLLRLIGRDLPEIRGRRGGDVFECAYARLPEGCGKTVHCSGCAIRRSVTWTFITGESLNQVPAYLNRDMDTQFRQLGMLISTEKVWDMVLLRIDHIGTQPESQGRELMH